jgi:hypothetical protein
MTTSSHTMAKYDRAISGIVDAAANLSILGTMVDMKATRAFIAALLSNASGDCMYATT